MLKVYHVLHDLVQLAQFKKYEKKQWRNVIFSKATGLHYYVIILLLKGALNFLINFLKFCLSLVVHMSSLFI